MAEQNGVEISYHACWTNCCLLYEENTNISLEQVFLFLASWFSNDGNVASSLMILNLDETNALLQTNPVFLQDVLKRLAQVIVRKIPLFVICSGTHATDLYKTIQASSIRYQDISLPLLTRDDSLEVIYSLAGLSIEEHKPSLHLCYTIDLLGVVGRYLELFIKAISVVCYSIDSNVVASNFTLAGLKLFLSKYQHQPNIIQNVLDKFIGLLKSSYNEYFFEIDNSSDIRQLVPLLAAYSLFEYPIYRGLLKNYTFQNLETMGFIFIKAVPAEHFGRRRDEYLVLEIPFITLHIIYRKLVSANLPRVQFLYSLDSYLSSEECELSSFSIIMFRLWAYHYISENYLKENQQKFQVPLSSLLPIRHYRNPEIQIVYWANFAIQQAPYQITKDNFNIFKNQLSPSQSMAYLNRAGAPYGDCVIFCEPPIVIQEKQSVLSRKNVLNGEVSNIIASDMVIDERLKIQNDAIFVLVTDERDRPFTREQEWTHVVSWNASGTRTLYERFVGKMLSLRRITQLGIVADDLIESMECNDINGAINTQENL